MTKTVQLTSHLIRGETEVNEITLREPKSGELRGLKLVALMEMDVNSMRIILPRITQPALTKSEAESLNMHDLMNIGMEIVGFFEKPTTGIIKA